MCEPVTPGNPFALCSLTQTEYVDKGLIRTVTDFHIAQSKKKSELPVIKERTQPPSYGELGFLRAERELQLTRRVIRLVEHAFESSTAEKTKKTFEFLSAAQKEIADATAGYEVFVVQNVMKKERALEKTEELLKELKGLERKSKKGKLALKCLILIQAILTTVYKNLRIYKDFVYKLVEESDEFNHETDFTKKFHCLEFTRAKINKEVIDRFTDIDVNKKESCLATQEHDYNIIKDRKDLENLKRSKAKCEATTRHWDKTVMDITTRTVEAMTARSSLTAVLDHIILFLPEAILPKAFVNKPNPVKLKAIGEAYKLMVECAKGVAEKRRQHDKIQVITTKDVPRDEKDFEDVEMSDDESIEDLEGEEEIESNVEESESLSSKSSKDSILSASVSSVA